MAKKIQKLDTPQVVDQHLGVSKKLLGKYKIPQTVGGEKVVWEKTKCIVILSLFYIFFAIL